METKLSLDEAIDIPAECLTMCPEFEMIERAHFKEIDKWEQESYQKMISKLF
jgi:hypothetical protein